MNERSAGTPAWVRGPLVGTRTSGPQIKDAGRRPAHPGPLRGDGARTSKGVAGFGILAMLTIPAVAGAQDRDRETPVAAAPGAGLPFPDVGLDQKLGERIPLDLVFRDETGRRVRLGDLFGDRPVVLTLAYDRCPMLCSLVLNGLASGMKPVSLEPGKDFTMITVSIDHRETPDLAAASARSYVARYGRPGAEEGWRFLTGDEDAIASLAAAAGFRYAYEESTGQYAHPSAVMILTPDGRLSRYLMGVEYAPRDLRLALVESSEGRIGTLADALMLLCYRYDPASGRYGSLTLRLVRSGGVLTVLAIAAFVLVMLRRDARRSAASRAAGVVPRVQ